MFGFWRSQTLWKQHSLQHQAATSGSSRDLRVKGISYSTYNILQEGLWLVMLVVSTHLKNMIVKLDHFPKVRGENKKYLKPPPSCWFPVVLQMDGGTGRWTNHVGNWTCGTQTSAYNQRTIRPDNCIFGVFQQFRGSKAFIFLSII